MTIEELQNKHTELRATASDGPSGWGILNLLAMIIVYLAEKDQAYEPEE
jgi:hypothetical protein